MKRLIIIGSRDLAQLIAHHAPASDFHVVGFIDDFRNTGQATDHGPILGQLCDFESIATREKADNFIIAAGYKDFKFREQAFDTCNAFLKPATIIHPTSVVDETSRVGVGSVLLPGCILDAGVEVGDNTVLNIGASIAHDSSIGKHCFVGPRAVLTGFVQVGNRCFIGANSTIVNNLSICEDCFLGAGCVITKPIGQPGVYVGVPARRLAKT